MHPILARGRLSLYLGLWASAALFLGVLVALQTRAPWAEVALVTLPLAFVYAFVCMSSWYVAHAMPLAATGAVRILVTAATASAIACAMWLAAARAWIAWLVAHGLFAFPGQGLYTLLAAFGLLFYLLALAVSYLFAVLGHVRAAERRGLEAQVLAREAELRMLRAQIDPHFLFNSLHSISALTTADPPAARRMCVLLAELLRESLALGGERGITLERELSLVARFLAIERVRYGARLDSEIVVGDGAAACIVPPLLLLPIVENAVTHGIAHMLSGGEVRVRAERRGERLVIAVVNPCDPDRPRRAGGGVGLANVRARLAALHGGDAGISAGEENGEWRVELALPASRSNSGMLEAGSW